MSNWVYKQQEIDSIDKFPDNTYGFVYIIKHLPTSKMYIGKKILQNTRKVKLTKKELKEYEGVVGRRPAYRLAVKESNWKDYWGSNKVLNEFMDVTPIEEFERRILATAPTKKLLTYYEVKYQMVYEVLERPEDYFNSNILAKFYTKDFEV